MEFLDTVKRGCKCLILKYLSLILKYLISILKYLSLNITFYSQSCLIATTLIKK